MKVLVGVTGSVAAIKVPELCAQLRTAIADVQLRIVATERALAFLPPALLAEEGVLRDEDEWAAWRGRGDPILHIELRRWADVILVAPLDANSLAKAANGLCDNLLTCVLRAWDFSKPAIVCPAMNTAMWQHPTTSRHLELVASFGYAIVAPTEKTLMCGDVGVGAMADVESIVAHVVRSRQPQHTTTDHH